MSGRRRTDPRTWQPAFLEAMAGGATITDAAAAAAVSRSAAYEHRSQDPDFARRWDDAYEQGTDKLEAEAIRRARDGTLKPVMYQGEVVEHVREYSDTLMLALLKARRPTEYRERQEVHHTGDAKPLTSADLARARSLGARPDLAEALEVVASAFADQVTAEVVEGEAIEIGPGEA